MSAVVVLAHLASQPAWSQSRRGNTSRAPLTDSSHKSIMNSSRAMDSLSIEMSRWHSCGRKNSISS
jgi:hypothetical protein